MQCLGGFCLPCASTVRGMAWSDELYRTVWERESSKREAFKREEIFSSSAENAFFCVLCSSSFAF